MGRRAILPFKFVSTPPPGAAANAVSETEVPGGTVPSLGLAVKTAD